MYKCTLSFLIFFIIKYELWFVQMVEIMQHLTMCKTRCKTFKGREKVIQKIQNYLRPTDGRRNAVLTVQTDRLMVIYGESGSGKTSVIAKVRVFQIIYFTSMQIYVLLIYFTSMQIYALLLSVYFTTMQIYVFLVYFIFMGICGLLF